MIERGIVEQVVDSHHVRVRIPTLNKGPQATGGTPFNELQVCPIVTPPGVIPALKVGDMVVVGFEHADLSYPVVLGVFFNSSTDSTQSKISANTLSSRISAVLPMDTTIGDVTPEILTSLVGIRQNVQSEIDRLTVECSKLREDLENLRAKFLSEVV